MKKHALPLAVLPLVGLAAAALAQTPPRHVLRLRPHLGVLAGVDGGAAPAPPDPDAFAADPPGEQASPAPTPDEWKTAPPVHLAHDVEACRGYRVREWLKLHCSDFPAAGVSLLAGTRTGVSLWVDPPKDPAETMKTLRSAELIFPVRRGDGRLFQIGQFGEGYDGPVAWNLAYTVSEQWIEGDRAPIITVR